MFTRALTRVTAQAPNTPTTTPDYYPEQSWYTLAGQVIPNPAVYDWITVHTGPTPYTVVLDLSATDQNDKFVVKTDILLKNIPPFNTHEDLPNHTWYHSERHELRMSTRTSLEVDGQVVDQSSLAFIQPIAGPWIARLTICQTHGVSRTLRAMVV
jgi:hypothetical protein